MSTIIETELKDILSRLDQRFDRLDQRMERLENEMTGLKVAQAEIKGDLNTIKTELAFVREDVLDLKGSQRAQIWALIGIIFTAVVSAVIKFGFFANP